MSQIVFYGLKGDDETLLMKLDMCCFVLNSMSDGKLDSGDCTMSEVFESLVSLPAYLEQSQLA